MSLAFSIIGLMLLLTIALFSILSNAIILIVYSVTFSSFMIIRLLINIKLLISFDKLVKRISPEHIEIYITKSWTRKREGAVWVGVMYIITLLLFLSITGIVSHFVEDIPIVITSLIVSLHIFIIIVYMFTNIQSLDSRLKISEKRISLDSMEWIQIRKDQSNYYKLLLTWYIHILFIIPLILMILPFYRNFWNNTFKN